MLRKTLILAIAPLVVTLAMASKADSWGAYHAGYTHYGPYTGVQHVGYTGYRGGYGGGYRYGGYGGDRYGGGGYHYGYHYGGYGGGYRYGYARRW